MIFKNRKDAGERIARSLEKYRGEDAVVFALPRGGVVLGAEIARWLSIPLDLIIAKKIGHPGNPEYAICAVAEEGEPVCNMKEVARVDPKWFEKKLEDVRLEIARRRQRYIGSEKRQSLEGKTAIIVDDGIATGLTIKAAIAEIKSRNPEKLIVAVPVVPYDTVNQIAEEVDSIVALHVDQHFVGAVGAYYYDFIQVEDKEVIEILNKTKSML